MDAPVTSPHGDAPVPATASATLPLARYRFTLRTLQPAQLPRPAGSLWRGVLGRSLRKAVCLIPQQQCSDCLLNSHCVYPRFFERLGERGAFAAPPRPFVPEYSGPWGKVPVGERLSLHLVVFGSANTTLPYLIHAVQKAASTGIGRERARLRLATVEQQASDDPRQWTPIVDAQLRQLAPLPVTVPAPPPLPTTLRVQLLDPLRLKQDGHLVGPDRFTAQGFLQALQRRYRLLTGLFGSGEAPPPDPTTPVLCGRDLHWRDWTRWSARQRSEMQLGGLLGHFDLDPPSVAALWPLLWWGQWLHLGSATSFGLGGYQLLCDAPAPDMPGQPAEHSASPPQQSDS